MACKTIRGGFPEMSRRQGMRSEDEIVRAHDLLDQVILGDIPEIEASEILIAAEDVLCWILCHDHNPTFSDNLQRLRGDVDEAGYELHKVEGPETATGP